jgi:polygalacturonase
MSDFLITSYGAVGDGQANDTGAIQTAIDACAEAGGERVVLSAPLSAINSSRSSA